MTESNNMVLIEIDECSKSIGKTSYIVEAISEAEFEIQKFKEDIASIERLKPECDKLDYTLAACSGALCGIVDVFLVGIPKDSVLGNVTDKWFGERTKGFAKLFGWESKTKDTDTLTNAISWLEDKFKVPYDQTSIGESAKKVFGFDTDPSTHHFESLGHNPSLLGLFFSILNQFTNTSTFIIDGQVITLEEANGSIKLQGHNIVSKIFCGAVNWFLHLISDVSGSSTSARNGNRGMGIPSPLWTWVNDLIAIKQYLGFEPSEFDKSLNQFAVDIFKEGFDMRFQTTQAIPVVVNELIVRLFYCIRRLVWYFKNTPKGCRSFKQMWHACKPYGNPTIQRMLTVAHGTFCLIDVGDATIRGFVTGGGAFNPVEFFLRLNLAGIGRFTISLYGEAKRELSYYRAKKNAEFLEKRICIVQDYIAGLNILKQKYDDSVYLTFVEDINNNEYVKALNKTASLAILRGVPESEVLKNAQDIEDYFTGKRD